MRKQHSRKKRRVAPKTVLRLPDLDQAKSAVLNSLTSVDAQRGTGTLLTSSLNGTALNRDSLSTARLCCDTECTSRLVNWRPAPLICDSALCDGSRMKQRIRNTVNDRIGIHPTHQPSSDP
jgi:hypothetical protein